MKVMDGVRRGWRFGWVVSCAVVLGAASALAEEPTSAIAALMEKSGLNVQIGQLPAVMLGELEQMQQQKLPAAQFDQITNAIAKSFDPARMTKGVRERLAKTLSAEDMKSTLTWLTSPIGEKVTALEKAAASAEAAQARQAFDAELQKGGPRVEQLKRLNRAVKGSEHALEMASESAVAIRVALEASATPSKQPDLQLVKEQVRPELERIKPMLEQQMLLSLLYTYRDLPDEDLAKYIGFAETEPGKRYHQATMSALSEEVAAASSRMGELLGKTLKDTPRPAEAAK